jgi:hypothetical protein
MIKSIASFGDRRSRSFVALFLRRRSLSRTMVVGHPDCKSRVMEGTLNRNLIQLGDGHGKNEAWWFFTEAPLSSASISRGRRRSLSLQSCVWDYPHPNPFLADVSLRLRDQAAQFASYRGPTRRFEA